MRILVKNVHTCGTDCYFFVGPGFQLEIHLPKSEWSLLYLLDSNTVLSDKVWCTQMGELKTTTVLFVRKLRPFLAPLMPVYAGKFYHKHALAIAFLALNF